VACRRERLASLRTDNRIAVLFLVLLAVFLAGLMVDGHRDCRLKRGPSSTVAERLLAPRPAELFGLLEGGPLF
jgi:hypothetical protein